MESDLSKHNSSHSFQEPCEKSERKFLRYYSHSTMRAQGIKALQAPSTYILAIIASIGLYYVDKKYRLENVIEESKRVMGEVKEGLTSDKSDLNASIDTKWILLFAVLFLSFVLALKRVYQKRRTGVEADQSDEIVDQRDSLDVVNNQQKSGVHKRLTRSQKMTSSCEQISQEEYDYQSTVITKNEINKLVQSNEYKRRMMQKGSEVEKWNWQAQDRQDGIYPQEENEVQLIDESNEEEKSQIKQSSSGSKQKAVSPFRERQQNIQQKSNSKQTYSNHPSTQATNRKSSQKKRINGYVAGNENSGSNGHEDTISKHLSFDSPSMKHKKVPTPASRYVLRSSPHILRSTYQSLQ